MKKNENGRSMVEMLGVLAIIGVLSLAGVSGYTLAMRKYRANEIIQAASIVAIMAQSANAGEGDCVKLSETGGMFSGIGGLGVNIIADPSVSPTVVQIQILADKKVWGPLCSLIMDTVSGNGEYSIDQCGAEDVDCATETGD